MLINLILNFNINYYKYIEITILIIIDVHEDSKLLFQI